MRLRCPSGSRSSSINGGNSSLRGQGPQDGSSPLHWTQIRSWRWLDCWEHIANQNMSSKYLLRGLSYLLWYRSNRWIRWIPLRFSGIEEARPSGFRMNTGSVDLSTDCENALSCGLSPDRIHEWYLLLQLWLQAGRAESGYTRHHDPGMSQCPIPISSWSIAQTLIYVACLLFLYGDKCMISVQEKALTIDNFKRYM